MLRTALIISIIVLIFCHGANAQSGQPTNPGIAEFFRGIVGEWVGVCKQATDGQTADDKYFHAQISESATGSFSAAFEYYRLSETGTLVRIGSSSVTATIAPTGSTATSRVTGTGEVLVDKKPRKQEHDLTEALTLISDGSVQGTGTGTLKVAGMPLGVGKLGKVRSDTSSWSLSNGTLSIRQSLSIVFKALCFGKSFKVDATYTAVRGSDVASQIPKSGIGSKIGG